MILKKVCFFIILFITGNTFAQRYELQEIVFEGNNEISSSTLSGVIYSQETPWWFYKFLNSFTPLGAEPVYFDSSNISVDLEALTSFYNANGFFEAEFSYSYEIDTADQEATLTYTIEENEQSFYGNLNIQGLAKVPGHIQNRVWEEMAVKFSDKYNQEMVEQKISKSLNILLNNGFMFAQFDSTIIIKDTIYNSAHLNVYFTTGNEYSIDTVLVEKTGSGAHHVEEQLLRKITGINGGDLYSLEKIRRSQVRLFRTGLFNSVNLSPVEEDTAGNIVPLSLQGNIGLMNELSPEIILNDEQHPDINIGFGINYIRKNFLGEARRLNVGLSFGLQNIFRTDFSRLFKDFSFRDTTLLGYFNSNLTIEQPYMFGKPIHGTWNNYAKIDKRRDYNLTRYGSKITFEFELPHYTFVNFLSTSYNIEQNYEVYRLKNDSLSSKLLSIIGVDMGRTTTDNILFPTEGYNISLSLEEANILPYLVNSLTDDEYSGALFYRVLWNNAFYLAVDRKRNNIVATKFKTGYLQPYYGDYAGVPLSRTFYAGGSNSVRGWSANELVPEGTPTIEGIIEQPGVNVKGGTFLLEGSLEYRYHWLESFGVMAFFDYGNVWLGYNDFRWDNLALATGLGFRYYTQVAPFRIDFGFKLYNPATGKYLWETAVFKTMEFHFGIGEAF